MCVALTSCGGDYCIVGVFNPGGTITGGTGVCAINKVFGNVSVSMTSAAASSDAPMAPNLLHIYVTLQGIEAHPSATAPDDSPDWEELAPDLSREPIQIDLLAHQTNSCAANLVPAAPVSAGAYHQIRLRLVPNRSPVEEAFASKNACGELGFHCAVSPDGRSHPLILDSGATTLRVAPDRISGGFFSVLPDVATHLTIEFNPFSTFASPSGEAVQIIPVFSVEPTASCSTDAASHP
ncbi:MAG: DUF4382 domain-containing protein [Candidatus Acidiferrales bacterium]